jgi:hypothetical protein
MELNLYIAQKLAEARARDLRVAGARGALLTAARPGRRGFRPALRAVLVHAGRWLVREARQGRVGAMDTRASGRS